ncbi:hypothetical protein SLA2020_236800 [Shorea laevis]
MKKINHFSHPHPLVLVEDQEMDSISIIYYCSACHQRVEGSSYNCSECDFHLHKSCAELPREINHPFHLDHPLILYDQRPKKCPDVNFWGCNSCRKSYKGFIYYCSPCEFGIKPKYAFFEDVIKSKNHEHPFTLLSRPFSFICDACGTDGEYCIPHVCPACDIVVHKECISLPQNILITRHDHPVSHIYFLEEEGVEGRACKICHDEIKTEHGCYHCRGCNYFVHVACAMDKDIFIRQYEVTDEHQNPNQINLGWLIGEPSITRVLKEKRIGEEVIAIEIEHFDHGCKLILCDDVKDEKCCDGCRLSISTSFYYCAECNYILHKRCAELLIKTRYWAFKETFTLQSYRYFRCDFCCFYGSGLTYISDGSAWKCCISCSLIPDTVTTQGHRHQVFFDHKFAFKCSICVNDHQKKGPFTCRRKECDHFAVNYTHLVLPNTARYKHDAHPLVLTHRDDIHHHSDQCVCDICEESRNPNEWFYYCGICDNSAHFLCILSKYRFLKLGLTSKYRFHEHPLTFVKKDYFHDYLTCSNCDKYCKEIFFKCTQSGCMLSTGNVEKIFGQVQGYKIVRRSPLQETKKVHASCSLFVF